MPFYQIKLYIIVAGLVCSTLQARSPDAPGAKDSTVTATVDSTKKVWNPVVVGGLSAVLPGAGQFYTGHYVRAGAFLALEVVSGSVANFWYREWQNRTKEVTRYTNSTIQQPDLRDSLNLVEVSKLAHFDALSARYSMYDALSWMVGGYIFNILDGVGCSRYFVSDDEKSTRKAACFAAIPALGLGQLYNGSVSKAGMVMMTQVSLGVVAINEHRLLRECQQRLLIAEAIRDTAGVNPIKESYLLDWKSRLGTASRNRNTYLWYSLFFYVYGILDAVVDAHLHDYDRKIRAWPDLLPQDGGAVRLNVDYRF